MDESDDRLVEALLRDIRAMDAQLHGIVQEFVQRCTTPHRQSPRK